MSDDDSDDDVPLSAMPAVMKVASSGSGQTETVPISFVESSSDEEDSPIFGFNKTTSNKSRAAESAALLLARSRHHAKKHYPRRSSRDLPARFAGSPTMQRSSCIAHAAARALCILTAVIPRYAASHRTTLSASIASRWSKPTLSCARAPSSQPFFARYGTFIGEVQDVRYATTSDGEPGPRGDRKEHLSTSPRMAPNSGTTSTPKSATRRSCPLTRSSQMSGVRLILFSKGRGARGQVWIPEVPGVVVAGYYPGRVVDVRVEAISPSHQRSDHGKVSYLVQYDAGDRHWHDLGHPRWRWKPELPPSARPGATQSLPNLSRQASSSSRKDGDAEDGGLARRIKSKEALVQLQEERRKKEERDKVGVKKESKEKDESQPEARHLGRGGWRRLTQEWRGR